MSLFSNHCQGRLSRPLPCPRPRGDPFIIGECRVAPRSGRPGCRAGAEESHGARERCRAHVPPPPPPILFHSLDVFANEQLKFCSAQQSIMPKCVNVCFKVRKHNDTP